MCDYEQLLAQKGAVSSGAPVMSLYIIMWVVMTRILPQGTGYCEILFTLAFPLHLHLNCITWRQLS